MKINFNVLNFNSHRFSQYTRKFIWMWGVNIILGFVLSLMLLSPSLASDFWVSPGGSDTAPGTATNPVKTIQRAITIASPGDTILVNQGEYGGFQPTKNLLTIKAVGHVQIIGTIGGRPGYNASSVKISGFHIKPNSPVQQLVAGAPGLRFENMVFDGQGIVSYLYRTFNKNVSSVDRCVFKNAKFYGIWGDQPVSVNHCTFANSQYGIFNGSNIKNSIFVNLSVIAVQNSSGKINFNDFWNNGQNYSGTLNAPGPNDAFIDPQFVDASAGILYLKSTSPVINTGEPKNGLFSTIGARPVLLKLGASQVFSNAADSWVGWTDDNGKSVDASDSFIFTAFGDLTLDNNTIEAGLISPPINLTDSLPNKAVTSWTIDNLAFEFQQLPIGFKQTVDSNPTTLIREIQYRTDPSATPSGSFNQTTFANQEVPFTEKFIQFRLVLRRDGNL